jgi:hypothetical protein
LYALPDKRGVLVVRRRSQALLSERKLFDLPDASVTNDPRNRYNQYQMTSPEAVRAPCGKANAALFRKRRSTDRHSHRLTPATLDGVSTTLMNEQTTETPSTTRRVTDTTLLIVAIVAVATWLWRRLRRPATVDAASETTAEQTLDDKIGGAVGFPPNNAPV